VDHLAIMKPAWKLLPKILSGEKTIESRWYQTKRVPWNKIEAGDTVFFKNSGEPVTVRAKVQRVLQFDNLNPAKIKSLLKEYGQQDGIEPEKIPAFFKLFKNKRYCLLIFLEKPMRVAPFEIDKTGFGAMTAWLTPCRRRPQSS
jgi:ASC-1-like (ASCH) protein